MAKFLGEKEKKLKKIEWNFKQNGGAHRLFLNGMEA